MAERSATYGISVGTAKIVLSLTRPRSSAATLVRPSSHQVSMPQHHSCQGRRSARPMAHRQIPAPASRLMQKYVQLLFEHPNLTQRGQLWLGHGPPPLYTCGVSPSGTDRPLSLVLTAGHERSTAIYGTPTRKYSTWPGHPPRSQTFFWPRPSLRLTLSPPTTPLPPPLSSTPLGRSARRRQRIARCTLPLCSGGHII